MGMVGKFLDTLIEPSKHIPPKWMPFAWVASVALAVAGNVIYVVMQDDVSWWLVGVWFIPLLLLVVERQREDRSPTDGGMGDGPWGPPG